MFNGNYSFVKAEVIGASQKRTRVHITTLTTREAADPSTNAGVLITFSNGIDHLIVIGEDVYKLIHKITAPGWRWSSWDAIKLPKEAGDDIIKMLNMREK